MKYCRWTLVATFKNDFCDEIVFQKSFRTIDEAVKVCTGFRSNLSYYLVDNDSYDDPFDRTVDITEFVDAQRDFERHVYCTR